MKISMNKTGGLLVIGNNWHGGAFKSNCWFGFARTKGQFSFCITAFHFAVFFVNHL